MLQEVRDHKKDRDSELTRKLILDAAEKLFSERGFAGTSVRDISEASGVSQPLIHHHFGSKKMLYHEVKKRAIERFWERWIHRTTSENGKNLSPDLLLSAGIETLFWFVRDNENVIRLGIWACLEGDTALWPGEKESIELLAQEIARAQEAGVINPDVDPRMFTLMVEAVIIFWWQYRSNLIRLFVDEDEKNLDKVLDDLDRKYLDNVLRIFSGCKTGARHEEGKEHKN